MIGRRRQIVIMAIPSSFSCSLKGVHMRSSFYLSLFVSLALPVSAAFAAPQGSAFDSGTLDRQPVHGLPDVAADDLPGQGDSGGGRPTQDPTDAWILCWNQWFSYCCYMVGGEAYEDENQDNYTPGYPNACTATDDFVNTPGADPADFPAADAFLDCQFNQCGAMP